jgi:hypothetical protein
METILYKVMIDNGEHVIEFGFNDMPDAVRFLADAAETVDGFEEGYTKITLYKR